MEANLTLEAGHEVGRRWVIRMGQVFLLGRGQDVSIKVDDEKVSRRHVAVELTPEGLQVTDLGSRNGSFLAGAPLAPQRSQLAAPDDTLQIGDHRFLLELQGLEPQARRERARTQRLDEPLLPREEFEILGQIGRGAMGRVYSARQPLLGRNVAIKVLRSDLDDDAEFQERFRREGRLACMVDSEHVVEVYDVRVVGPRVYLVMELVNGPSARDRLFGPPLPLTEVLDIGEDVARGLAAAHRVGVVHRDIKPANILLTPAGKAKLTDFGIAKDLASLESLTAAGEGLGTLSYVSPEQATDAKRVDARTDIYSLGATLYHLVSGRPPFEPHGARILLAITNDPPPPLSDLRDDCPPELAALIHKMLEKDRDARPPRAASIAAELAAIRAARFPNYRRGALDAELMESTDGE